MTDTESKAAKLLIRIDSVLGNASDGVWAPRLDTVVIDECVLDQWEAQKSRLRCFSSAGSELAIALDRGVQLRDGDVLAWDEVRQVAIVARIMLSDVMVVDVADVMTGPDEAAMQTCIEVGHALGNQHWPAVVKGTNVYVPLTVDRTVMESVMKTHAFEGVTYAFIHGEEVIPYLAPHETRRLFGAAERPGLGHGHAN